MEGNSTISSTSPAPGVLLLSCGTGEGHNSAASALGEALKAEGIPYEQKDPLSFGGSRAGERAASAYTLLIQRAPGAFNSTRRGISSAVRTGCPLFITPTPAAPKGWRIICGKRLSPR